MISVSWKVNVWALVVSGIIAIITQKILANTGVLNTNSMVIDLLSFVVIFALVYGAIDFRNLKKALKQR
ncbi:hypothetical protein EWH99_00770 [Sporolactobacillus sp. THM7-7]|nr:hypothetical protein EWH99_00770 [Sporolactobacillus sp. THM7-7]